MRHRVLYFLQSTMDGAVVFGFGDETFGCCDNVVNEKLLMVVVMLRAAGELCDIVFYTFFRT